MEPILFLCQERSKRQKTLVWLVIYTLLFILIGWILATFYSGLNITMPSAKYTVLYISILLLLSSSLQSPLLFIFIAIKGISFGFVSKTLLFNENFNMAYCLLLLKNIVQITLLLRILSLFFHPFFDKKAPADQLCYFQYLLFCTGVYGLADWIIISLV